MYTVKKLLLVIIYLLYYPWKNKSSFGSLQYYQQYYQQFYNQQAMPQQSQAQQGYVQYPAAAPAQYVYYSQQAFGWVAITINNEIAWFKKYSSIRS